MKTGRRQIAAMYVDCPYCGESYDGTQDGSMLISMHNVHLEEVGQPVRCSACSQQYRLPTALRKCWP